MGARIGGGGQVGLTGGGAIERARGALRPVLDYDTNQSYTEQWNTSGTELHAQLMLSSFKQTFLVLLVSRFNPIL